MYRPAAFNIDDGNDIAELVQNHPLGMLISTSQNGIQANPVPFLFDPSSGEKGMLSCHLSRANPQLDDLEGGQEVLVLFQGINAYVSPSLYASKKIHSRVVPTWNYCVVEARGIAQLHSDTQWLRAHVGSLTRQMEADQETPWKVEDAPDRFTQAQLGGIVGVSIALSSLSGKFKLSQNRPAIDRDGLINGMESSRPEMARLIARYFPSGKSS